MSEADKTYGLLTETSSIEETRNPARQRHLPAQPVGVVVQFPERGALGAEEALAPHIGAVAADPRHAVAVGLDLQAAHCLTQRTSTEVRRHGRTLVNACVPRALIVVATSKIPVSSFFAHGR